MLILHEDSHTDHVAPEVISLVLKRCANHHGFFIEEIEVPIPVPCDLYGPAMGDDPVAEEDVMYVSRGDRKHLSRVLREPVEPRTTNKLTVIGGPHNDEPCVLYTCYGGPKAPKEVNDPSITPDELAEAEAFWREHAIGVAK